MAKYKTFYGHYDDYKNYDSAINDFLINLENNGDTLISMNTITYGTSNGYMNRFRTEIIYQENPSRTVLTEKSNA